MFFLLAALLLPTADIVVGGHPLRVELANTTETRALGLQYRDHLEEGQGMLFVFETPELLSFWMKNTSIPLSIAFFDEEQTVLQVETLEPFSLIPKVSDPAALLALEVPRGWFEARGIGVGAHLTFQGRVGDK